MNRDIYSSLVHFCTADSSKSRKISAEMRVKYCSQKVSPCESPCTLIKQKVAPLRGPCTLIEQRVSLFWNPQILIKCQEHCIPNFVCHYILFAKNSLFWQLFLGLVMCYSAKILCKTFSIGNRHLLEIFVKKVSLHGKIVKSLPDRTKCFQCLWSVCAF